LKDAAKIIRKEKATGASVSEYDLDPSQECLCIQGDVRLYIPEMVSKHYPDIPTTAIAIKEIPDEKPKSKK
jgi:translation initiation factor 1 (eIF-1/SUI1)